MCSKSYQYAADRFQKRGGLRAAAIITVAWVAQNGTAQNDPHVAAPQESLRMMWSVDLKAPSFGSAAAGDLNGDGKPEIVFGTYFNDGHVYALNGADGRVLWKHRSDGGPFDASILILDVDRDGKPEVLCADSAYGTLYCLNAKGEVVWKYKGQSGTDSPPAAADLDGDGEMEIVYGTMKAGDRDGFVNCLSARTGKGIWSVAVPGHIQSEPGLVEVNGDGVLDVLVTNWMGDNRLRALSGKDGKELWRFDTGDWIYHGISAADFDADQRPEIIVADRKGTVWMLRATTGERIWETRLEGEAEGMVFAPTTLVDADRDGIPEIVVCGTNLHLLDSKGKVRWRNSYGYRSIARGVAVADVDGDGVPDLIFGEGTTLRAVRADTGGEVFAYDLKTKNDPYEGIDHAPLILDVDGDGQLDIFVVVGRGLSGNDEATSMNRNYGRAVALRTASGRADARNAWTTFRGNNRRTGSQ
ncbi:MAG: hypothetical protein AMXMBFR22_28570 [Phycisphaerae bacterium]